MRAVIDKRPCIRGLIYYALSII